MPLLNLKDPIGTPIELKRTLLMPLLISPSCGHSGAVRPAPLDLAQTLAAVRSSSSSCDAKSWLGDAKSPLGGSSSAGAPLAALRAALQSSRTEAARAAAAVQVKRVWKVAPERVPLGTDRPPMGTRSCGARGGGGGVQAAAGQLAAVQAAHAAAEEEVARALERVERRQAREAEDASATRGGASP
jgi:hypothetical protein